MRGWESSEESGSTASLARESEGGDGENVEGSDSESHMLNGGGNGLDEAEDGLR
jgi:hypothetical protein